MGKSRPPETLTAHPARKSRYFQGGPVLILLAFIPLTSNCNKKMEKWIILSLLLFALVQQTEANWSCPVDVAFIMDSSGSISEQDFQKEKDFVKQAALLMNVAPGHSRAAIILFTDTALVKVTLGQHQAIEEFKRAVDSLDKLKGETHIDRALNVAADDVFSKARTDVRRVAILLSDGVQTKGGSMKKAIESLRKLGVRVLAIAMGQIDDTNTKVLRSVTERNEDFVKAEDFNDLQHRLPRIIACGSCVCTSGDSYISIDNYQPKKNRAEDDIRFEFKSDMTGPGVIMWAQGDIDHLSVGYYQSRQLFYNIDLGSGEKELIFVLDQDVSNPKRAWDKVNMTRSGRSCHISVKHPDGSSVTVTGKTPGSYSHLDLTSDDITRPQAYFLGSPESEHWHMKPNFVGCIRYFAIDGYEPIVDAWMNSAESSMHKGSMRPCTASDEMY
ncbi:hypothetical protein ACROYT_G003468 [Oculina patagonica]